MERARQYLAANEMAVRQYRELARQVNCDMEEKTSYVYSLHDRQKIEREEAAL